MVPFLTSQQVADRLKVTDARVRQLVGEGRLPRPVKVGPRLQIFNKADIDAYVGGAGHSSPIARSLSPADKPLRLITDAVVRRESWSPTLGGTGQPVHVRIYRGDVEDQERTVVLLSEPVEEGEARLLIVQDEQIVHGVAEKFLDGLVHSAVWVQVWPKRSNLSELGRTWFTEVDIDNIILTNDEERRRRDGLGWHATRSPMSINDLDGLLGGAPIDWYEWSSYRPELIAKHQRTGRPVAITYDPEGMQPYRDALRTLENLTHPEVDLARQSVLVSLALRHSAQQQKMKRLGLKSAPGPEHSSRLTVDPDSDPGTNTVQAIPFELEPDIVAELPDLENVPGTFDDRVAERERLRQWRAEVDEYSDDPQPHMVELIDLIIGAHGSRTMLTDSARATTEGQALDPGEPVSARANLAQNLGPWGDAYLQGITPREDPRHDPNSSAVERRQARELAKATIPEAGSEFRWGTDKFGNLMCLSDSRDSDRPGWFSVMWPRTYADYPLPEGVQIVGDGDAGDLPIYLQRHGELIGLLPRDPSRGQWNFGYGGGGPGALVSAVLAFLEKDGIPADAAREHVQAIIEHPPEDKLSLDVDTVRTKVGLPQ